MQVLHNSRIGDFTRGGQVIIHFLRMIGQVLHRFFGLIVVLYVVMTIGIWLSLTQPYDRYVAFRFVGAHAGVLLGNGPHATVVRRHDGGPLRTTIGQVAESDAMEERTRFIARMWIASMTLSMVAGVGVIGLVMVWLLRFGASHRKEQNLRGQGVVEREKLADMLKRSGVAGRLQVAGVPMVKNSETLHILVTGSPGSGKTTALFDLLAAIRERGDRCICYSPSGDLIERFYEEGDTILNPFDARCPTWDLWEECRTPEDHFMVAASIIPDPSDREPMWNNAARQVMSAISEKMGRVGTESPSIGKLLWYVNRAPLKDLVEYLADTDAAALLDQKAETTSANIRTNTVTFVNALRHLPQGRMPFSIRKWVATDRGSDWVFLNARPNQLPVIRPVLSMWLQVFTNCLMSLPDSQVRRVWLVIDELPSLQKIRSLADFFAQSRKYGGCGVIAFQQLPQLAEIYGDKGAMALAGLTSTWVCMRQNDPDTAEHLSKKLGEIEVMENQQGISYGANEIRDGVSLNAQRKMRRVVTATEIMQLDNLEGYVKVPGQFPAAHFKMRRREMQKVAPAFLQGMVDPDVDAWNYDPKAAVSDEKQEVSEGAQKEPAPSSEAPSEAPPTESPPAETPPPKSWPTENPTTDAAPPETSHPETPPTEAPPTATEEAPPPTPAEPPPLEVSVSPENPWSIPETAATTPQKRHPFRRKVENPDQERFR